MKVKETKTYHETIDGKNYKVEVPLEHLSRYENAKKLGYWVEMMQYCEKIVDKTTGVTIKDRRATPKITSGIEE